MSAPPMGMISRKPSARDTPTSSQNAVWLSSITSQAISSAMAMPSAAFN